jgi:hypothetical protein
VSRSKEYVVRLEGIEPPLTVPKTVVLSVERQTQLSRLYPSVAWFVSFGEFYDKHWQNGGLRLVIVRGVGVLGGQGII